ncbi:LysR family transcriptional regulator [Marinobacter sp. C2H3]|uniref:LysR family transcriptional regulator n=1 Tax=Marinobacter sp. C2H3 TaxID=3119003 RepID=UPI00300EFB24
MKSRSDDLFFLLSVVDSGSFSGAAEQLEVSVTRVSRAVTRLEASLNTTLLNRTTRKVALTEEGHLFVEKVRGGLATLEEAEEQLAIRKQRPAGRLRVDAANPFLLHQIVPHVREFREAYPDIELELTASDQIVDLLERRIDIAIRIGSLDDSTLHARVLGRSPLSVVASPEYLKLSGGCASPADLQEHDIIGFTAPESLNIWHLGEGMRVRPTIRASSGEAVRQLCLQGNGIAYLSRFMIAEDVVKGRLVELLDDYVARPNPRELVSAVYYRNTTLASRIQVFLDFFTHRWRSL